MPMLRAYLTPYRAEHVASCIKATILESMGRLRGKYQGKCLDIFRENIAQKDSDDRCKYRKNAIMDVPAVFIIGSIYLNARIQKENRAAVVA